MVWWREAVAGDSSETPQAVPQAALVGLILRFQEEPAIGPGKRVLSGSVAREQGDSSWLAVCGMLGCVKTPASDVAFTPTAKAIQGRLGSHKSHTRVLRRQTFTLHAELAAERARRTGTSK
jgi:hypothetical protein